MLDTRAGFEYSAGGEYASPAMKKKSINEGVNISPSLSLYRPLADLCSCREGSVCASLPSLAAGRLLCRLTHLLERDDRLLFQKQPYHHTLSKTPSIIARANFTFPRAGSTAVPGVSVGVGIVASEGGAVHAFLNVGTVPSNNLRSAGPTG